MVFTPGIDISRYQYPWNPQKAWDAGDRFVALRVTIGDYYTDPNFAEFWDQAGAMGFKRTGYLVTAPKDSSQTRFISASAHLDLFYKAIGDRVPDMPWVVDAELTRGATKAYITDLHYLIISNLYAEKERYPIVYSRQTWWDYNVNANSLWAKCPLWAARYTDAPLTSPWSDGNYIFRDWNEWAIWQYSSHGDGPKHGTTSLNVDLDHFNGDEAALAAFCGTAPPLTDKQKLDILWREAALRGWNLTP